MGDLSVTNLYRKVVSPSMKYRADELKKDTTHIRHVQYRGRSPVSPRRIIAPSSSRSTYSAPGRVESRELALQSSVTYGCLNIEQDGHYNFHPTTRFKTTSLPAMPLTKKYSLMAPGSTRTVPLSVTRHSALSLPEKWPNDKPLFRTQQQRKSAEESAKSECRKLKRKSEIISHRIDKQYYMSGIKMPVKSRWDVDTNDLLRLKLLAHHKQLANYKNMKSLQNELESARESPGGQTSTPTPDCDKKNGSDDPRGLSPDLARGPGETEGKWAEDSKSETSSIDEFDIISTRGRRIKLPSNVKQNGHTSDDVGDVKKKDELEENPRDSLQENNNKENEKNDKELAEDSTEKEGESKESEGEERRKKAEDILGDKTDIATDVLKQNTENRQKEDQITEPSSAKPRKKVKSIRFKDELNEKSPKKADKMKAKEDGKSNEENQEEQSDDHVNPYMDEWLGVKKKQVDGRYKPGKPPPNRIFISGQISKSKKATAVAKFSEMFLTEMIALQDNQASFDNDASPESKFSIINTKQREAFKSMFDEVDKDKNGSVTLEELKMKMMPTVTRDDIKHFVQVFDLNKDKTVDSREFTAICSLNDRLAGTRTETADGSIALELEKLAQHIVIFKEMYKTMDEDDDNRLDVNEVLIMVSAAMETEMGADLDVARRVLGAARDEFGYIDFIGFMSYIPFFAKLLKNIMAKPLSIAEIEKARDRVKQKELTLKPKISNKKEQPKSWEAF